MAWTAGDTPLREKMRTGAGRKFRKRPIFTAGENGLLRFDFAGAIHLTVRRKTQTANGWNCSGIIRPGVRI